MASSGALDLYIRTVFVLGDDLIVLAGHLRIARDLILSDGLEILVEDGGELLLL